jgi:Tfp pilus assembly protein PilN
MRAVNLLPREHVEQKRGERPNAVILVSAVGGAAVVLALAAGFLLANRSVDRERQALNDARAVLAVTPAHQQSARTAAFRSNLLSQREQRSLALAAALGKRVAWDRILRRIALVMPDDVWLTSLTGSMPLQSASALPAGTTTAAAPPSAFPTAPTALTMQGYTYSQAGVARLLERLQVLPDLKNVQLQDSEGSKIGTRGVINFTIVSDIRKGKGAS